MSGGFPSRRVDTKLLDEHQEWMTHYLQPLTFKVEKEEIT